MTVRDRVDVMRNLLDAARVAANRDVVSDFHLCQLAAHALRLMEDHDAKESQR